MTIFAAAAPAPIPLSIFTTVNPNEQLCNIAARAAIPFSPYPYPIDVGTPTIGTFTVDETISQATTGAVGKVVEWDPSNKILYYIQTRHNDEGVDTNGNQTAFSGTNIITGADTSATLTPDTTTGTVNSQTFSNGYSISEIDHGSGDIVYVENRAPITRAADQTENIKLIIEF